MEAVLTADCTRGAREAREAGREAVVAYARTPTGREALMEVSEHLYRNRRSYVDGLWAAKFVLEGRYEADELRTGPRLNRRTHPANRQATPSLRRTFARWCPGPRLFEPEPLDDVEPLGGVNRICVDVGDADDFVDGVDEGEHVIDVVAQPSEFL